jgi:hypothetical protein
MPDTVVNNDTGEVQPATIPFYKSPVAVGSLVAIIFQIASVFFPGYVPLGLEEDVTQAILQAISGIGAFVALVSRWRSNLQPLSAGPTPPSPPSNADLIKR